MSNTIIYAQLKIPIQDIQSIKTIDKTIQQTEDPQHITFNYTNEDLVNIINHIASLREINIMLPQGANAINAKLTFSNDKELSLEEAWTLLLSFLDAAGYSVINKNKTYHIIKTNKEIARNGLPVYIGDSIELAKNNDERIVYIHYFTNMKTSKKGASEVQEILKTILPDDTKFTTDANKNVLIVAARAKDIKHALIIFKQLDKAGFKEKIDFIHLEHSSARIVADLFNENILQQKNTGFNKYRLDTRKKPDSTYFSKETRLIADERTNSLIVIGHEQAIERLKKFINKHIDVEPESGTSVLHVYNLMYLDANEFKPVIEKIVASSNIGSTGQARAEGRKVVGPERFFDEVIISVDRPSEEKNIKYYGGNNLIIACRNDDWLKIKELIEELDSPQPQVFIEVLIADLTLNDQRALGALTRNPDKIPLINLVNFQSAQLPPGVIVDPATDPKTINGDLLRLNADSPGTSDVLTNMTPGSTAISLNDNDGQTWSVLQILKLFEHSKIISHPHMVATNNKLAEIKVGERRLVPGDVTGSIGSNTVRKLEDFTADLKVSITPRISSADTVNLDVTIEIEEFLSTQENSPKATRTIKTNANVISSSILALGGLIRNQSSQGTSKTPIFADVPVLGWFFKDRSGTINKNNLTVFISPTIVPTRLRKGIGDYTQDYIDLAHTYANESVLFDSLKDPITRLYFRTEETFEKSLNEFVSEDEFISQTHMPPEPIKRKKQVVKTTNTDIENQETKLAELLKEEKNPFSHTQEKQPIDKQPIDHQEMTASTSEFDEDEKNSLLKALLKEEDNPFA